jgi:hypothetical protein
MPRTHPLPVLAPVDDHGIARLGELRGAADHAEGVARGAVSAVRAVRRHMQGRHRV